MRREREPARDCQPDDDASSLAFGLDEQSGWMGKWIDGLMDRRTVTVLMGAIFEFFMSKVFLYKCAILNSLHTIFVKIKFT